MPKFDFTYCRQDKDDVQKTFNIPKNENAPEHLDMKEKPIVYVIDKIKLEELLTLCAVPIIDPLVLSTMFIRFWPEVQKPDAEWDSFGIKITRRIQDRLEVTLGDLFQVKYVAPPTATGTPGTPPTLEEVFFLTCMQFRLCDYVGAEYGEYVNNLKTRMTNLGKSPPYKVDGLQNLRKYEGVTDNENLQTIIAGLDMYLMKFPKSTWKILRMGTIVMRLKDMGAWSAIKSMYSYVGDDAHVEDSIFRWLFSAGIGAELMNLIEGQKETDQLDSYYPYARSMNLIQASYASVSNNPNLHLVVHIIGTLKGNSRSGNARHVSGAKEGSALRLALWITMGLDYAEDHYMWYRSAETYPLMKEWEDKRKIDEIAKKEPLEKEDEEDVEGSDITSILGSDDGEMSEDEEDPNESGPSMDELREALTPELFYQLGVERKFIIPKDIYTVFQKRVKGIQYRQGTVGKWLQIMLK